MDGEVLGDDERVGDGDAFGVSEGKGLGENEGVERGAPDPRGVASPPPLLHAARDRTEKANIVNERRSLRAIIRTSDRVSDRCLPAV
jgi:hypothetical protein